MQQFVISCFFMAEFFFRHQTRMFGKRVYTIIMNADAETENIFKKNCRRNRCS